MKRLELGSLLFTRRRAGRFGGAICFALALASFVPALLLLFLPRSPDPTPGWTALGFGVAVLLLIGLTVRALTTGLWVYERGLRSRAVLGSGTWRYDQIQKVTVEEPGGPAAKVVIRFEVKGRSRQISLLGNRDPGAQELLALMRAREGNPVSRSSRA